MPTLIPRPLPLLLPLLLAGMAACSPAPDGATTGTYRLRESVRLPPFEGRNRYVAFVGDIDGDGQLEAVARINYEGEWAVSYAIYEQEGDTMVVRHRIRDTQNARDAWVADVDGDGLVEVAHGNHEGWFKILEPDADHGYTASWSSRVGTYLDYLATGDLDGDGRPAYLLAMEAAPAQVRIIEATAPDHYEHTRTILAPDAGYAEPSPPMVADLLGDGRMALIFGRKTHRDTYVFLGDSLQWIGRSLTAFGVGDLDGNGIAEIAGTRGDRLRIVEPVASLDSFRVVLEEPIASYDARPRDLDGDGVFEIASYGDRRFTLSHRHADRLVPFFDSGDALAGFQGRVMTAAPIARLHADAPARFFVQQGDDVLHVFGPAGPT